MKKGIFALALTVGTLCAAAVPAGAAAADFPDVEGHYAEKVIQTWSDYGVLQGYLDGTFRPEGSITRAELATVLDRVMGYQDSAENTFTDLPENQWYTKYLLRLAEQGIFTGDENRNMNPNSPITRQEVFTALARALGLEESDKDPGFSDDRSIASWAKGYIAAMKEAGYIEGDLHKNIRPEAPITRAEVVTVLNRMAAAFVNQDGTYSQDCTGNLYVNAHDVTLKDMTIQGDLIVTEGVADGDVYLDNVTVKGDILLKGCGVNSFHIMPGCKVSKIIVTKTTRGGIRIVNESGKPLPMIWVNDGYDEVVLAGDELKSVVINDDVPVMLACSKVGTVAVNGNSKVTVNASTTVSRLEASKTAKDAEITVKGTVNKLVNDGNVTVDKQGGKVNSTSGKGTTTSTGSSSSSGGSSSGGSSSGGSSSGGSSSGGSSSGGTTTQPTTISEVTLGLVAPVFAAYPDTAYVTEPGYSAETVWQNADGTTPDYRWKMSSTDKDTFTADHLYQAVITLTPNTDYVFSNDLKVTVSDQKNDPTIYPTDSVVKQGDNYVVTVKFPKTAEAEYILLSRMNNTDVTQGESTTVTAHWIDNLLIDPSTHKVQWYKCSNTKGENPVTVSDFTTSFQKSVLTIPASETQNEGNLYYYCIVTAGGKKYTSTVATVTIFGKLPEVGKPVFADSLSRVSWDSVHQGVKGFQCDATLSNMVYHPNIGYESQVTASVKVTVDGIPIVNGTTPTANTFSNSNKIEVLTTTKIMSGTAKSIGISADGVGKLSHHVDFIEWFPSIYNTQYSVVDGDGNGAYGYVTDVEVLSYTYTIQPVRKSSSGWTSDGYKDLFVTKTYNFSNDPIICHFNYDTYNKDSIMTEMTEMSNGIYNLTLRILDDNPKDGYEPFQLETASWFNDLLSKYSGQTETQLLNQIYTISGFITCVDAKNNITQVEKVDFDLFESGIWKNTNSPFVDSSGFSAIQPEYYLVYYPGKLYEIATNGNVNAPKTEYFIYPLNNSGYYYIDNE